MTIFTCSSIIEHLNNTNVSQKLPPETPAVTLIASNWRAGAEHQKECETLSPFQCAVTKEPQAKVGQLIPIYIRDV